MKPEALQLLLETPVMMRLAAGWPLVTKRNEDGSIDRAVATEWAAVSGVGLNDVRVWMKALFGHGIVLRDGSVDPQAMAVIRHRAWSKLPKDVRDQAKRGNASEGGKENDSQR